MKHITNAEARERVVNAIVAAKSVRRGRGSLIATDWTRAKWLATGERAVVIVGGFANSVIHSPAGARDDVAYDRLLFFGPNATLVHEEAASSNAMGLIGFA